VTSAFLPSHARDTISSSLLPATNNHLITLAQIHLTSVYYHNMSQRLINLLLSASLFSMALADDTFKITGNAAAGTGGGVAGLIVLVLDVLVFGSFSFKAVQ